MKYCMKEYHIFVNLSYIISVWVEWRSQAKMPIFTQNFLLSSWQTGIILKKQLNSSYLATLLAVRYRH